MENIDEMIKSQKETMLGKIASFYEGKVDRDFLFMMFDKVMLYKNVINTAYGIKSLYENLNLFPRIASCICENYWFDVQRMEIKRTEEYENNFVGRIVAQIVYSRLSEKQISNSRFLQHPAILILLTVTNLLIERTPYDASRITKERGVDYLPVLVSFREALISLSSTYVLMDNKAYPQAFTVYRQYLEQLIIAIALAKNPKLFEKYKEHQRLTIKYATDVNDAEVKKVITEKKINARDIKSFLNYGWLEDIPGFENLGKARYSIKSMAKLANIEDIYELYAQTSNYVHMNFLYADVNWINEINKNLHSTYFTIDIIMSVYRGLTGFDFVYMNVDLMEEFNSLQKIVIDMIEKSKFSFVI